MKTYKLKINKDFYFFKRKNKSGNYDINFIFYSKRRIDEKDVYVFLNTGENLLEIEYLGHFLLQIEDINKDLLELIKIQKEIFITEIDKSKRIKPLSYIGKVI